MARNWVEMLPATKSGASSTVRSSGALCCTPRMTYVSSALRAVCVGGGPEMARTRSVLSE